VESKALDELRGFEAMVSTDDAADRSEADRSEADRSDAADPDAAAVFPDGLSAEEVDCACAASGVIDLLSRKYAIPVFCVLAATDTARFGDFEELIGSASTSTLSARLDEIVDAGLATRTQYDEIPPRVEYELTADGRELGERLQPLVAWAAARE
jgi:DNA-binding HxlR family transcriptional regulator